MKQGCGLTISRKWSQSRSSAPKHTFAMHTFQCRYQSILHDLMRINYTTAYKLDLSMGKLTNGLNMKDTEDFLNLLDGHLL